MLYLLIVIEGYIVLATELLAIRQTIPYVGSGTDTVSIIIAAVLMPLAFGYQYGGRFKPRRIFGRLVKVRDKLIYNIVIASTILLVGLSHDFIRWFFGWLFDLGIENRLLQTSLYSGLFLVLPVYLLGQTVPLVTNFFSKERLARIAGKILFFSTIGSFMGAVFSTIFLMSTIGVHHTVSLNFVLATILVVMLSKKPLAKPVLYSAFLAVCAMIMNSDWVMAEHHIRKNNQYAMIQAGTTTTGDRVMKINNNHSSKINDLGDKHDYIDFAERVTLAPIAYSLPVRDILVIGAGAFTYGSDDTTHNFVYVDIDEDLKEIAEKHVLKKPLGENKIFVPMPARAYFKSTDQKFDVIFLDAYLGGVSVPEHLITKEFFEAVKSHLKDDGIMLANLILSPHFNNVFTKNIDNTIRSVFPHVSRQVINDYYSLWSESETLLANVAYIYRHDEDYEEGRIYTDNKNTVFYDKPKKLTP